MQSVQIKTTQNVDIEYEIATVGDRILASVLDLLILIAFYVLIIYLMVRFELNLEGAWGLLYLVILLPFFFYDLICEISMDGQSFGKKLIGIKVIKLDGSQPSLGSYLLRWILRLLEGPMSFGAISVVTILINGRGQRIGDIAAGTTVVRLKQKVFIDDTILVRLDGEYSPSFPQAEKLSDEMVALIKEVLDFQRKNRASSSTERVLERATTMLEEAMGVKNKGKKKDFLETVLKDYNYFSGRV